MSKLLPTAGSSASKAARRAWTMSSTADGFDRIGAWIIGRNMFCPVRGP